MKLRRFIPILLVGAAVALSLLVSSPSASGAESNTQPSPTPVGSGQDNAYAVDGSGLPKTANPGQTLFNQHCSSCHGVNGEGSAQAPSLIGTGKANVDFWVSTGRMPLRVPVKQAPRAKPLFTAEQRKALVDYVGDTFGAGGPDIPMADASKGNLVEGNQLFANNCAQCHNSAGSGGALGGQFYAPNLYDATAQQTAEAIRVGPGAMPIFGPKQFSDEQVNSLVAYVHHLQTADEPGGLAIGKYGPVAEGFVAWVIGLGALLGISRWMGTRI